jgi:hypothetical protein
VRLSVAESEKRWPQFATETDEAVSQLGRRPQTGQRSRRSKVRWSGGIPAGSTARPWPYVIGPVVDGTACRVSPADSGSDRGATDEACHACYCNRDRDACSWPAELRRRLCQRGLSCGMRRPQWGCRRSKATAGDPPRRQTRGFLRQWGLSRGMRRTERSRSRSQIASS